MSETTSNSNKKFRTLYDGIIPDTGLKFGPDEVSRTKQSFQEECDINTIVAKSIKAGQLPLSSKQGIFADVSEFEDFQTAHEKVQYALDAFQQVPAKVRDRFGNDPQKFFSFCQDQKNLKELKELGLLVETKESTNQVSNEQNGGSKNSPANQGQSKSDETKK